MRKKSWASISSLLFASLFWVSSPGLAQKASGANEKEFADRWKYANPHFLKGRDHFLKKDLGRAEAEASHAAFAGSDGIIESQRRRALLDKRKKMEQEVAFMEDTSPNP